MRFSFPPQKSGSTNDSSVAAAAQSFDFGQSSVNKLGEGSSVKPYHRTVIKNEGDVGDVLSISAMPEYEAKSHDEIRLEDYQRGNKGSATKEQSDASTWTADPFRFNFSNQQTIFGGKSFSASPFTVPVAPNQPGTFGRSTPVSEVGQQSKGPSSFGLPDQHAFKGSTYNYNQPNLFGQASTLPTPPVTLFGTLQTGSTPAFGSPFPAYVSIYPAQPMGRVAEPSPFNFPAQTPSIFSATPASFPRPIPAFGTSTTASFMNSNNQNGRLFGSVGQGTTCGSSLFGASGQVNQSPLFGTSPQFNSVANSVKDVSSQPHTFGSTLFASGAPENQPSLFGNSTMCKPVPNSITDVPCQPNSSSSSYQQESGKASLFGGPVSGLSPFVVSSTPANGVSSFGHFANGKDKDDGSSVSKKAPEAIVEKLGFDPWKNDDDHPKGIIIRCQDAEKDAKVIGLAEFAVDQQNAIYKSQGEPQMAMLSKVLGAWLEAVHEGRYHIVLEGQEASTKRTYAVVLQRGTSRMNHVTVLEKWVSEKPVDHSH